MRDPDEKARFRGNDKAYEEGYERIFGKKKVKEECEHFSTKFHGEFKSHESDSTFLRSVCSDCGKILTKEISNERK